MTFRPDVIPAVCVNGHLSYPSAFVLRDRWVASLVNAVRLRKPCPACGARRQIPPGRYEAGANGVLRAGNV